MSVISSLRCMYTCYIWVWYFFVSHIHGANYHLFAASSTTAIWTDSSGSNHNFINATGKILYVFIIYLPLLIFTMPVWFPHGYMTPSQVFVTFYIINVLKELRYITAFSIIYYTDYCLEKHIPCPSYDPIVPTYLKIGNEGSRSCKSDSICMKVLVDTLIRDHM